MTKPALVVFDLKSEVIGKDSHSCFNAGGREAIAEADSKYSAGCTRRLVPGCLPGERDYRSFLTPQFRTPLVDASSKTTTMQYYQHEFTSAEDYLHHRPPYLMVDRIVSVAETEVAAAKEITGEEFFIRGHFPGAPIFPGAMMQELSTQTAGILIAARYNPMRHHNTHDPEMNEFALGVLVRVNYAKFKGFARPGDTLVAHVTLNEHVDDLFDFSSTISIDDKPIMRNSFRLTNIASRLLRSS